MDLKLLADMGVTPDRTEKKRKKPTLKMVGTMIRAAMRMKKMQEAWAGNKKLHETLMNKVESMRKQGRIPLIPFKG